VSNFLLAAAALFCQLQYHRFASFQLLMMRIIIPEASHQRASARAIIADRRSKLADSQPREEKNEVMMRYNVS
jgi:hypothetical protein